MPEKSTLQRARRDRREGKAPSTQAGEFVREEIHHIREGKHGARSAKQAIAIGLSKARRAGVKLPAPPAGAKATTKRSAKAATRAAKRHATPSRKRSQAMTRKLRKEGRAAASHRALSEFVKRAGFALLASLVAHDKRATDAQFMRGLALIEREGADGRNFVKKASNWALRCIGKRNPALNAAAVTVAQRLASSQDAAARWVGKDALRELTSPAVARRLSAAAKRRA